MFRSYVANKAWKKAMMHFTSLSKDELIATVSGGSISPEFAERQGLDFLTPQSGEDGFGLLRRNVSRVLEGLHQVCLCADYQFWEQRHPIEPDVHAKLRTRLKGQVKDILKADNALSSQDIRQRTSQEIVLAEHAQDPAELQKARQLSEKKMREEEKRSVREAARKLLEIEMKAQEAAKEAQRKAKEERKNAVLEARMEIIRQKEARKEALRLAKEEERRMREEEREIKRALREEEKRKKQEDKENSMKRRIEELRQRRKLREEQKSILENGVMTTEFQGSGSAGSSPGSARKKMRPTANADPYSAADSSRQKHLALLGFVEEEKNRRRRIRVWEKKAEMEQHIWKSVQTDFIRERSSSLMSPTSDQQAAPAFPSDAVTPAAELDAVPSEISRDVLYVWDFIATFADCLRLPVLPSLAAFVEILALGDGSSPVGDGSFDDGSLGFALASLHATLLKLLMSEYFPILQTGTTLDEFYRTRPMNGLSWPELARLVCLLSIEANHPNSDEYLVKLLKGSKSYKDDSVVTPLRRRLFARGTKLLQGLKFEEAADGDDTEPEDLSTKKSDVIKSAPTSASYYGVVFASGLMNAIDIGDKDGNLVVKSVGPAAGAASSEQPKRPTEASSDAISPHLAPGDYIWSVNGRNVRDLSLVEFSDLINGIKPPHGVMLSKTPPPVKGHAKHYATTTGASKLKRCAHVLKILRGKEIAIPFNLPVDADLYPDYYSSITDAMDLGTIAEKLEDEDYENDDDVESFMDDVALVWKNCYTYNSVKAEISSMARKLSVIFDRLMKEWVFTTVTRPLIVAEEDYCRNCQTNHVKDRLLLCDRCDAPYHSFCLDPPLAEIPQDEWYCPVCRSDPSFSPDQFRKKIVRAPDTTGDNDTAWVNEYELSDFEKQVLSVSELLAKENYSDLTIGERVKVLKVLCELVQGTAVVQSVYHSVEEKANKLRREYGESLADLEREWSNFGPSRTSHNIEQTKKFFIDGVEHDLTDELLEHLQARAKAEMEGLPPPELPVCARPNASVVPFVEEIDDSECSADSEEDEEFILEVFSDQFLNSAHENTSSTETQIEPATAKKCAICGLHDGILNGSLVQCKRLPLSHQISQIDEYEVPDLLVGDDDHVIHARTVNAADLDSLSLRETPGGVVLYDPQSGTDDAAREHDAPSQSGESTGNSGVESDKNIVFAINDRFVGGMSSFDIMSLLRAANYPLTIYLSALPYDVLRASVTIVRCHSLELGLNLASFESRVFVQSFHSSQDFRMGLGEVSGRVFPGDVLLMIDHTPVFGKEINEVQDLLRLDQHGADKYVLFVRPPTAHVKALNSENDRLAYNMEAQRAKVLSIRQLLLGGEVPSRPFDVVFQPGPLGLALGLEEGKVTVTSLNDYPTGALGQASLSGQIREGDLVERVNNLLYGSVQDLSQFTSWLLSLPRPLKVTFSRRASHDVKSHKPTVEELLASPQAVQRSLGLSSDASVKTYRYSSVPWPFEICAFGDALCVVATRGIVRCGNDTKYDGASTVEDSADIVTIGDRLVGMNGHEVSGVSWPMLAEMAAEMSKTTPVLLHFAARQRERVVLAAHLNCVQVANTARSECEFILPQIEQARQLETFLESSIPRTLPLGRSHDGYLFYRFFCDRKRLYIVSPTKTAWSVCQGKPQLDRVLLYLNSGTKSDRDLGIRIQQVFHAVFHGSGSLVDETASQSLCGASKKDRCCEFSHEKFLREGPFAAEKDVVSANTSPDMESYEAGISCHGRRFTVGAFGTRQAAELAGQHAKQSVLGGKFHLALAFDAATLMNSQFPPIARPMLKADTLLRRSLARKYEYNTLMGPTGVPRAIPVSHYLFQVLKRGLQSAHTSKMTDGNSYGYGSHGDVAQPAGGIMSAQNMESLKRKLGQPSSLDGPYQSVGSAADRWKRSRLLEQNGIASQGQQSTGTYGIHPNPNAANGGAVSSFKQSLQSLVERGRSMLAAWNQFAASASPQSANGLAYACLSSFEEVKKTVSRILMDPNRPLPDSKTFVCLHHAYVMGLICAMTSQALTASSKTAGDSALVKLIADCFATSILNCMDPSTMLRSRALNSLAVVAKQCEPTLRAADLSPQLHNVANFILQFVRASQYLATGNFEDLSRCRSVSMHQSAAVVFPVSFIQQIALLENVRTEFMRRRNTFAEAASQLRTGAPIPVQAPPLQGSMYGMPDSGSSAMMPQRNAPSGGGNEQFIHVSFDHGPLGIVINYSDHGTIIVTEFSNDNGAMGQAQATGKLKIGDEVYAVDGRFLEVIGMEGFKAIVASGNRPLQVTFRRQVSTPSVTAPAPLQPNFITPTTSHPMVQTVPPQVPQVSSGLAPTMYSAQSLPVQNTTLYGQEGGLTQANEASMASGAPFGYPQTSVGQFGSAIPTVEPLPFNPRPDQASAMGMGESMKAPDSRFVPSQFNSYGGGLPNLYTPQPDLVNYGGTGVVYGMQSSGGAHLQPGQWQNSAVPIVSSSALPIQNPPVASSGLPAAAPFGGMPPIANPNADGSGSSPFVSFVAPNDPRVTENDPSQVTYYDANETTYRGVDDFELDTSSVEDTRGDESRSISQLTTPMQSDTEEDSVEVGHQNENQVERLEAVSTALQSSASAEVMGVGPQEAPSEATSTAAVTVPDVGDHSAAIPNIEDAESVPAEQAKARQGNNSTNVDTAGEPDANTGNFETRRSTRVSKKITTNIADMYDPNLSRSGHSGMGGTSSADVDAVEPTDGEFGQMATELLEEFHATIRPLKTDGARSLMLLRAQLLVMEAATPREAFRNGKWSRRIRAAWAELVCSCDSSRSLLEAIVFLESCIEPDWLDPCWKASPVQTAKNAVAGATIASAAMRLYALDDAIMYVRTKRSGKRKHHRPSSSASSSRQSSPTRVPEHKEAPVPVSDTPDLSFLTALSPGIVTFASKLMHKLVQGQREKTLSPYALRKVCCMFDVSETCCLLKSFSLSGTDES